MSLTRCYVVLAYWPTFQLKNSNLVLSTLQRISQFVLNKSFPFFLFFCPVVILLHFPDACPSLRLLPPSSGSPAELCQLCVDDEIVAVNGVAVAHMNYTQWKDKMTSSLQTGGLTMDIRRYGNKGKTMCQKRRHSCLSPPP